jgi:hypothetical protein
MGFFTEAGKTLLRAAQTSNVVEQPPQQPGTLTTMGAIAKDSLKKDLITAPFVAAQPPAPGERTLPSLGAIGKAVVANELNRGIAQTIGGVQATEQPAPKQGIVRQFGGHLATMGVNRTLEVVDTLSQIPVAPFRFVKDSVQDGYAAKRADRNTMYAANTQAKGTSAAQIETAARLNTAGEAQQQGIRGVSADEVEHVLGQMRRERAWNRRVTKAKNAAATTGKVVGAVAKPVKGVINIFKRAASAQGGSDAEPLDNPPTIF